MGEGRWIMGGAFKEESSSDQLIESVCKSSGEYESGPGDKVIEDISLNSSTIDEQLQSSSAQALYKLTA